LVELEVILEATRRFPKPNGKCKFDALTICPYSERIARAASAAVKLFGSIYGSECEPKKGSFIRHE
jgi:hypothetical protein